MASPKVGGVIRTFTTPLRRQWAKKLKLDETTLEVQCIAGLLPPTVGAFVTQAGMMALGWLFLYWLYRKNIFLRV